MAVDAVVREWHSEEGWGVIDAAQTPGGCWAHYAHIAIDGYRELTAGQAVKLEWEVGDQDGYAYRASRVWPADSGSVDSVAEHSSTAFSSTLLLRFDDPD